MMALIDEAKQLVAGMDDAMLHEFYAWVANEPTRREQAATAAAAQAQIIGDLQDAGTIPRPEFTTMKQATSEGAIPAWVDPGTDHAKMYPEGAVITHNGKTWVSVTSALNSWEPGTEHGLTWREITLTADTETPAEPAEWVHPTGAHDAYPLGAQVTYNGVVYESTIDANTYSPDDYPAGWKQIS